MLHEGFAIIHELYHFLSVTNCLVSLITGMSDKFFNETNQRFLFAMLFSHTLLSSLSLKMILVTGNW